MNSVRANFCNLNACNMASPAPPDLVAVRTFLPEQNLFPFSNMYQSNHLGVCFIKNYNLNF